MLRFRLAGIPVTIHPSHFLISGVFALISAGGAAELKAGLSKPAVIGIWVAIVFVSVMVHELGHALTMRFFGLRPSIDLVGLGGMTRTNTTDPIPWGRDLAFTAAGPSLGLFLGLLCGIAWLALRAHPALEYVFFSAMIANVFWTIYNLLPMTGLDGGRIATVLAQRIFGRPGLLAAHIFGLLVALGIGLAIAMSRGGWGIIGLFVALSVFRSIMAIAAWFRGDAPGPSQFDGVIADARRLFASGRLADARARALGVLDFESSSPSDRSRAHHLLGWVALREGRGRQALDHFSQASHAKVEPHALADAFALVGDDERALPLYELSYRDAPDPGVLHSWAAALIRLGRRDALTALPQFSAPTALDVAARVCHLRNEFDLAAAYGARAHELEPTGQRAYDLACAHARAGRVNEAVERLGQALVLGFDAAAHARADSDFDALRDDARFVGWLHTGEKSSAP